VTRQARGIFTTMNPIIVLVPVIGNAATAARMDFGAFVKAREKDRTVTFDWVLCAARIGEGALHGLVIGLGIDAAVKI